MMNARMMGTAIFMISGAVVGFLSFTSNGEAATTDAAATQLLTKHNCQACHTVDKKVVGPGYKEVAAKYAGDKTAPAKLADKVKKGSSGVWGPIPMPPNNVPDADIKVLVEWILARK